MRRDLRTALQTVSQSLVLMAGMCVMTWAVGAGTAQPTDPMKAALPKVSGAPGLNVATTATPLLAVPAYASYQYMGDHYRDPFIPLTGSAFDLGAERAPQISSLALKGIVEDTKGRMAIVSNGAASYILRAGRLYDGRNHVVKGISGVVKAQSVVLIGSDRTVKELLIDKSAL